jgi:ABC-type dipeptide/oligopeptide/nickel transport system ATPase component
MKNTIKNLIYYLSPVAIMLGVLAPIPAQYKLINPVLLLTGLTVTGSIIKENRFKGSPLEEQEKELNNRISLTEQQLIEYRDQLVKEQEEFEQTREKFLAEFDALSKQQLEWIEQETTRVEAEYQEKWKTDIKALYDAQEEELEATHTAYSEQIQLLNQQLQTYKFELYKLQKLPKKAPINLGATADTINSLLDTLHRITEERCDKEKSYQTYTCDYVRHVWSENQQTLTLYIEPKDASNTSAICRLKDELQVGLGFKSVALEPDKGAIKVTLSNEEFADSKYSESLEELQAQIVEPDRIIIKRLFQSFIHAFVWGESGSGKSTLVNNLIDLMDYDNLKKEEKLVNSVPARVKFYDPKWPHNNLDDDNILQLDGVIPDWKRFHDIYDVAAEILGETEFRMETHKNEADKRMRDKTTNIPLTKFNPLIYLIDEIENAIRLHGDDTLADNEDFISYKNKKLLLENDALFALGVSSALNQVLKLSRSSGIKLLGVAQSPMPIDVGLKRIDFLNCSRFWLGGVAKTILSGRGNEFVQIPAKQKREMNLQIELREKINGLRLLKGLEPIRYMVAHAPGLPVILMTCPSPHGLVEMIYGVPHKYQNNNAQNDPVEVQEKPDLTPGSTNYPDPVQMPFNPDRESLINLLENSLTLTATPELSETGQYIMELLQKYPDKAFTLPGLLNRRTKLKTLDPKKLKLEISLLKDHGYIELIPKTESSVAKLRLKKSI